MQERWPRLIGPLLAVFFVSGVSALVHQIVWLKHLGFVFGNSVYAAARLIAVSLAGLGFGGYLFAGRFRAQTREPVCVDMPPGQELVGFVRWLTECLRRAHYLSLVMDISWGQ